MLYKVSKANFSFVFGGDRQVVSGGYFETDDKALIKALESNPNFVKADKRPEAPKKEVQKTVVRSPKGVTSTVDLNAILAGGSK